MLLTDLMTWDTAISEDDFCTSMLGVVLKHAIGPFPAGSQFVDAMIDLEQGVLSLGTDTDDHSFSLELTVSELP